MSYKKSIKGDNNQASEQFAHNRIFVDFNGAGVVMLAGFVIVLVSAAVAWMILRNGSLLSILIILSFLALFIGAGIVGTCFLVVRISDMLTRVRVNKILSQVVVSGEVVAYRDGDQWNHLSAEHERAKVIPQVLPKEEQDPLPSEAYTIIDMHKQGVSFKKISEATLWTEYAVRKLCNQIDGKPS